MNYRNRGPARTLGQIPGAELELFRRLNAPKKRQPSKWPIVLFFVLLIIAIIVGAFFYRTFSPL